MPPAATPPRLNADRARRLLQDFRFTDLFIDELGWNNPTSRAAIPLQDAAGAAWTAREISELGGFRVFEVMPADLAANLPDAENQAALCQVTPKVRQSARWGCWPARLATAAIFSAGRPRR